MLALRAHQGRARSQRRSTSVDRRTLREHEVYVEAVKRAVAARKKNPLDPSVPLEPLVTGGRED
jgi:hypothetical protein